MIRNNRRQPINFGSIMETGKQYLLEDLKTYPPFDPSMEYPRKNDYFNRANDYGLALMEGGLSNYSELYYECLLEVILDYERENNIRFNKGMIYANLGISQIRIGKHSVGIPHLLTAEDEDKEIAPDFNVLNTPLWGQFEFQILYPFLLTDLNLNVNTQPPFTVTYIFLDKFFKSLNRDDRIFIQGTIWDIKIHLDQAKNTRINSYTLGQLYSALKDLCLALEMLLRKKHTTTKGTLPHFLTKVKSNYDWKNKNTSSENPKDFLDNIEANLKEPDIIECKLRMLHLIRNFTGHYFDVSNTIKSQTGKFFFLDLYEIALTHILSLLFYLRNINQI